MERKRWIYCLLITILVLGLMPIIHASAATSITTSEITQIIDKWKADASNGTYYWNAVQDMDNNTSEATLNQNVANGDFSLSGLGFTTTRGTEHGNRYKGNQSCVAFAKFISYCIWGSCHSDANTGWETYYRSSFSASSFNYLPGDVLATYTSDYIHYSIVHKVDTQNGLVYCMDVWGGNNNNGPGHYSQLHFGGHGSNNARTYSSLASELTEVYRNVSGQTTTQIKNLACPHPKINCGKCPDCLLDYSLSAIKDTSAAGKYTVTSSSAYMKEKPYQNNGYNQCKVHKHCSVGEIITVDYAVQNYYGSTWYHTTYNGEDGYVFSGDVTINAIAPTVQAAVNGSVVDVSWNSVGASSYYVYVQNNETGAIPFGDTVGKRLSARFEFSDGNYTVYVTAVFSNDNMKTGSKDFTISSRADLGEDFYAYIIALKELKHLEATYEGNVQIAKNGNDSYDPKQIWHFIRQSNGSYKIINEYEGLCLDAANFGTANGTNVGVSTDNGGNAQRWYIVSCGGYSFVPSYATNLCMDVSNGDYSAGTNIQLFQSNGTAAQTFSIYKLTWNGTNYAKPSKPPKPSISSITSAGNQVTVKWSESSLQSSMFDRRVYDIYVWAGTPGNHASTYSYSNFGITGTSHTFTLATTGTYTVLVAAVNEKYRSHYTLGDEQKFATHNLTSHAAVAATCTTAGNSAYWSCSSCGKYFLDAACTKEISNNSWVISALGHNYQNGICSRCGAYDLGDDFYAYIAAKKESKNLEANNESNVWITENGNDSYNPRQIWHFLRQDNGSYEIKNEFTGLCLDAHNRGTEDHTNVGVSTDNDSSAQRWFIISSGDGVTLVPSYKRDISIDVTGDNHSAGTNIQLFHVHGGSAQVFEISKLSNYVKPQKPAEPQITSVQVVGEQITITWQEAPLESETLDSRGYDIRVWAGTPDNHAEELSYTKRCLETTTDTFTLPSGTYSVVIAAVNHKYYEYYTYGNKAAFTVIDVPKTEIKELNKNETSVTANVYCAEGDAAKAVCAMYNGGKLVSVKIVTLNPGDNELTFTGYNPSLTAKLFVIDSNTTAPLCAAVTAKK